MQLSILEGNPVANAGPLTHTEMAKPPSHPNKALAGTILNQLLCFKFQKNLQRLQFEPTQSMLVSVTHSAGWAIVHGILLMA